jgi:hypothetical protein
LDITKLIFSGEDEKLKKLSIGWKKKAPGDISRGLWG